MDSIRKYCRLNVLLYTFIDNQFSKLLPICYLDFVCTTLSFSQIYMWTDSTPVKQRYIYCIDYKCVDVFRTIGLFTSICFVNIYPLIPHYIKNLYMYNTNMSCNFFALSFNLHNVVHYIITPNITWTVLLPIKILASIQLNSKLLEQIMI